MTHLTAHKMGDFLEFYDAEAKVVAKALNIALTSRRTRLRSAAGVLEDGPSRPMCGFPIYAVDRYLAVLTDAGFTVRITGKT